MSAQDDGAGWRVQDVQWDPSSMIAGCMAKPAPERSDGDHGRGAPNCSRSPKTRCQVEGCAVMLLSLRSYFQNQHICEEHFRAATITDSSGRTWRFCQQCCKLEPLGEFEGERRSCRASLERRHRRRTGRRTNGRSKRSERSIAGDASSAPGSGGGISSTVHLCQTASPNGSAEGGFVSGSGDKFEQQRSVQPEAGAAPDLGITGVYLQPLAPASTGSTWPGGGSMPPAHLLAAPVAGGRGAGGCLVQPPALGSQHATTWQQPAAGPLCVMGMGPVPSALDVDTLLSLDPDMLADVLLASDAVGLASLQAFGSSCGTSGAAPGAPTASQWGLPALAPYQQAVWHPASMPGVTMHAARAPSPPQTAYHHATPDVGPTPQLRPAQALHAQGAAVASGDALAHSAAAAPQPMDDLMGAEGDLEALLAMEPFEFEEARISLKLYGVHPKQLPPHLRTELLQALAMPNTVVQTALRAGCVHLTLSALLSAAERQRLDGEAAAATALGHLLPLAQQLPAERMLLQASDGSAALLVQPSSGRPAMLFSLPAAAGAALPQPVELLSPLATTVSAAGGCFRLRCSAALLDAQGGLALHCRRCGAHLAVSLTRAGVMQPAAHAAYDPEPGSSSEEEDCEEHAAAHAGEWVDANAWVSAAAAGAAADHSGCQAGWGLYEFEVARGALLGTASPVLVLPDCHAAAAAELAQLPPGPRAASVLRLVALVLRWLEAREGAAGPAAAALQAAFPALAVTRLEALACQLDALATRAGWPALAGLMRSCTAADGWRPACAALPDSAVPFGAGAPQTASAAPVAPAASLPASSVAQLAAKMPAPPKGGVASTLPASGQPELCAGDSLRSVMHPMLLGGISILVAGVVLGVVWLLTSGCLA